MSDRKIVGLHHDHTLAEAIERIEKEVHDPKTSAIVIGVVRDDEEHCYNVSIYGDLANSDVSHLGNMIQSVALADLKSVREDDE